MGRIYYLMGKSASGKDTIYRELQRQFSEIKTVVLYSTRPMREGEKDGREYFFVDEATCERLEEQGKIIELRAYQTVYGVWKYFTVDDGQILLDKKEYLMIGTLESYEKTKMYFGEENLEPLYIEVEEGLRLERALKREKEQVNPRYTEMCRRFLADEEDFSEEKLEKAGVSCRYNNEEMETCLKEIAAVIKKKSC